MWTSSDTNVATVGFYTGIVEAVGAGEVTITATTVDGSYVGCCIVKVRKTYSQRDFEIMSIDDRALMSCLQIVYAYYEDIGDVKSIRRQDEILRKINEIREKAEYKNLYTACTNTDTPILSIKTTKINVQRLHTLTKNDIIEMHNKDSILVVLASLIPTIGAVFSVLMALVQEAEQNGNIDFLGLTIEQVISYLLEENKLKWLGKILTVVDLVNILSTENRETYVKDGCRMAEGDTMVEIRLDYDLGCENILFHFVVRNNVTISCVKYGVTRVDRPADGYYNSGYINGMKEEWINEGYIAD